MARRDADDVIEKRDPNPVTISALVIAAIAILGAMVLQIIEIAEYGKGEAQSVVSDDLREFNSEVDKILEFGGSEEELEEEEGDGDAESDDEDMDEDDEDEDLDDDEDDEDEDLDEDEDF